MFVAVWRFTTDDAAAFEQHYGRDGTWAQLFRRSADYARTDLLTDGTAYLTFDWWTSREAYDAFQREHAEEYARIDRECEALTVSEERVGYFEEVAGRM
jgi:hypothetical protein